MTRILAFFILLLVGVGIFVHYSFSKQEKQTQKVQTALVSDTVLPIEQVIIRLEAPVTLVEHCSNYCFCFQSFCLEKDFGQRYSPT